MVSFQEFRQYVDQCADGMLTSEESRAVFLSRIEPADADAILNIIELFPSDQVSDPRLGGLICSCIADFLDRSWETGDLDFLGFVASFRLKALSDAQRIVLSELAQRANSESSLLWLLAESAQLRFSESVLWHYYHAVYSHTSENSLAALTVLRNLTADPARYAIIDELVAKRRQWDLRAQRP